MGGRRILSRVVGDKARERDREMKMAKGEYSLDDRCCMGARILLQFL